MRCPKCRSEVFGDEKFCRYCGQSLVSNANAQPSLNPSIPIYNQSNNASQQNTSNNQYNYQVNQMYSNSEDEVLLNEYIGKNASDIKANKFNFPMFFLGILYLFYRKMWLYAFGLLAVTVISTIFLSGLASLISTIINLYLSINFGKLYVSHAKDQIRKIKFNNSDKSTEQLIPIVRKKGGTSILAPILYSILYFILIIAVVVFYIVAAYDEFKDEVKEELKYSENLVYEVPTGFEPLYETKTYSSYNYLQDGETCTLSLSSSMFTTENKEEYYLNNTLSSYNVHESTETQSININGKEWKNVKINVGSSIVDYYVYVSENKRPYEIKFIKYNGETPGCDLAFNTFIQTVKFEERKVD